MVVILLGAPPQLPRSRRELWPDLLLLVEPVVVPEWNLSETSAFWVRSQRSHTTRTFHISILVCGPSQTLVFIATSLQ